MLTRILTALTVAGALAGATAAAAYPYVQTPVQSQVDFEINHMNVGGYGAGFDRLVFSHRGQMETGGRELTFVALLQADADYRVTPRCGADCIDLNLLLRDAGRGSRALALRGARLL
jgi:hypothetical protein